MTSEQLFDRIVDLKAAAQFAAFEGDTVTAAQLDDIIEDLQHDRHRAILLEAIEEIAIEREQREEKEAEYQHARSCRYPGC
jgi:hypothetical protein